MAHRPEPRPDTSSAGLRGLLSWARLRWASLVIAVVLSTLGPILATVLLALNLRYLLDAFYLASWPALTRAWVLLVGLALGVPILVGVGHYLFMASVEQLLALMRSIVYRKALVLPADYFDSHESTEIASLLVNDANLVGESFVSHGANLVSSVAGVVAAAVFLVAWHPSVILLIAALGVASFMVTSLGARPMKAAATVEQEQLSRVMGNASSLASGLMVIKSLRVEKAFLRRFEAGADRYLATVKTRSRVQGWVTGTSAGTAETFFPAVHLGAGLAALDGTITPGTATGIAQLSSQTVQPTSRLAASWAELHRAAAASDRVMTVLRAPAESAGEAGDAGYGASGKSEDVASASPAAADVEFQEVTFSYPSARTAALRDLTFHVPAGHLVAVVGETGSGKSTIFRVLLGIYSGYSGQVRVGHTMVTPQTLPAVRAALSICPQDRQLLPFSIWENLRLVAESDEKVLAVARSFGLDSMVAELPGGWDTPVEELSGGQQQRVALVRAFLKAAAVVLLDEPTAHLDAANESAMLDCIRAVRAGRTVLMSTHRVVNLAAVDRILVMSRGTIVEEGTFEELVNAGGLFAGFYREQVGASARVGCTERLQQD